MHTHEARIRWRGEGDFAAGKYSRVHEWEFDEGLVVPGSTAPQIVPPPLSSEAAVDPEEAVVAAAASCHMLSFLYLAHRAGHVVEAYEDHAVGHMDKNERGKTAIAKIILNPVVSFSGPAPSADELAALHATAHEECFIANSLRCEVVVEPR